MQWNFSSKMYTANLLQWLSPTRTTHYCVPLVNVLKQAVDTLRPWRENTAELNPPAAEQVYQRRQNGVDPTLRKPQLTRAHENKHNQISTYFGTSCRTPPSGAVLHQGLTSTEAHTCCLTSNSSLPLNQGAKTHPQKEAIKTKQTQ